MADDKTYNGWSNHPTWVVNLWMDNVESSQRYWTVRTIALLEDSQANDVFTKREVAKYALASEIKGAHEALIGEYSQLPGVLVDLLNSSLCDVRWGEIAESWLNTVEDDLEMS